MRWLIMMLLMVACGSAVVQDHAPAPIEEGQKRVETQLCDSHEVGENGCAFVEGTISGSLKIFKVYEGEISILGIGCDVDYSQSYAHDGKEWLELDLINLVGQKIEDDCVLTITQKIQWKGADRAPFPIKDFRGTVTLATCPNGVKCSMSYEQKRLSDPTSLFGFDKEIAGKYMLAGCGRDLVPPSNFSGNLKFNLAQYLPNKEDTGCMFILGVVGKERYKVYRKVWSYSDQVRLLPLPELRVQKKRVYFTLDPSVLAVSVDGYITSRKYFDIKDQGNYLRLYTSQGRSLVMFIKNGVIVWAK